MDRRERFAQQQDALNTALARLQSQIWTALPGIVDSYDPAAVTVVVQPTVKGLIGTPDGNTRAQDLPLLPDVPVCFPRGGGVTLTFPIKPGDECLVVFASRCIDGWWQSGGSQLAPEFRMHDLSDGFALIGPQSQAEKISNLSTDTAQLRSDDGQAFVEINPTNHEIRAKTPGNMKAEIGGVMTGIASAWNITGPVNITGTLAVSDGITAGSDGSGNVTIKGNVNATGDIVANGTSLKNHVHGGVQSGGDTSGKPA